MFLSHERKEFFMIVLAIFGSWEILREEKNIEENGFLMFDFMVENTKENQILFKFIKKLYIVDEIK